MGDNKSESQYGRIFTLSEATSLLPQLEIHLTKAKQGKATILQTKEEIKKASAQAQAGGGSLAGPRYIRALEIVHDSLHAIHEMDVIVKDLDRGLCDFPHLREGRLVFLCWELGETQIEWWHEINGGYATRRALHQ